MGSVLFCDIFDSEEGLYLVQEAHQWNDRMHSLALICDNFIDRTADGDQLDTIAKLERSKQSFECFEHVA